MLKRTILSFVAVVALVAVGRIGLAEEAKEVELEVRGMT